jgi:hypothetical protein
MMIQRSTSKAACAESQRKSAIALSGINIARSRSLVEHDLFGKPVSTRRVKPEGMLFRIML